nr:dihydroxyacetone kinase [Actinomyces oris]
MVIRVVAVVRSSLSVRAAMLASRVVGDDGAKGGLWCSPVERLTERCEGVLVLADLGSGIMSTEMALEMLDPALAERTRLSAAPFIEGLLGAYGAAGIGKDLQAVATEADGAAEAKRSQVTAF